MTDTPITISMPPSSLKWFLFFGFLAITAPGFITGCVVYFLSKDKAVNNVTFVQKPDNIIKEIVTRKRGER